METSTVSPRLAIIQLHPIKALDLALASFWVFLALYSGTNIFSPVRFDREKIDIYAADGQIFVRGLYHYHNRFPLPVTFSLGLPFPIDSQHAGPSAYSVTEVGLDGSMTGAIATRNYHGNAVFRLFFLPFREKWIRLDYSQRVAVANGRYILQTTREWGQPLDRGEYILHLNNGSELISSNYPLEKSRGHEESCYSFTRTTFYPDRDWTFSWKPALPLVASNRDLR